MVDVDHGRLDLDAVDPEGLELHHRHRSRRVLGERLVDAEPDLPVRERARRARGGLRGSMRAREAIEAQVFLMRRRPAVPGSEAQEGADPLDGLEILALTQRADRAPWGERLVNGEVDALVCAAPISCRRADTPRPRVRPARRRDTPRPADRTPSWKSKRARHARSEAASSVRAQPAAAAAVAPRLLLPALDHVSSPAATATTRAAGPRPRAAPGGPACASALVQPTIAFFTSCERLLRARRESRLRDDHERGPVQRAHLAVEDLGNVLQVVVTSFSMCRWIARLRPAPGRAGPAVRRSALTTPPAGRRSAGR